MFAKSNDSMRDRKILEQFVRKICFSIERIIWSSCKLGPDFFFLCDYNCKKFTNFVTKYQITNHKTRFAYVSKS
mgnify:CR=1 FL=1